jgi:hypothetical protein
MKSDRVPHAVHQLREGKREMREARAGLSLPEKVRQVARLQAATLPMIRRRRELEAIERVWSLSRKNK